MSAEIFRGITFTNKAILLQWGRAPMSAEMVTMALDRNLQAGASMGPRSDERGNLREEVRKRTHLSLQWGRAPMSAEIQFQYCRASNPHVASMGPRSDERGNIPKAATAFPDACRFNGAALR